MLLSLSYFLLSSSRVFLLLYLSYLFSESSCASSILALTLSPCYIICKTNYIAYYNSFFELDTETLGTFITLSQYRSYTKTADALFVAQSTVTNRIMESENVGNGRNFHS